MKFDAAEGNLSEKEEKEIVMTYTAKKPGNIDVIFACDVAGMQIPLGFQLEATISKGLIVSYSLEQDDPEQLKPGQPLGCRRLTKTHQPREMSPRISELFRTR